MSVCKIGRRSFALPCCAAAALFLISCSDDSTDPVEVAATSASAVIDSTGGEFELADRFKVYVPAGAVSSPTKFTVKESSAATDPPAGCMQAGPALELQAAGFEGEVAIEVVLPGEPFGDGVTPEFRIARVQRQQQDGSWMVVAAAGGVYPGHATFPADRSGLYAVHVDSTANGIDDCRFVANLGCSNRNEIPGGNAEWSGLAIAWIVDEDGTGAHEDIGGLMRIGNLYLDYYNGHFIGSRNSRVLADGEGIVVEVPGSKEVPAFSDTLEACAQFLELQQPGVESYRADRTAEYRITWSGGSAGWVNLSISDEQDDENSISWTTPDDGEFILTPEMYGSFPAGTNLLVYVSQIDRRSLDSDGYTPASWLMLLQSSSRILQLY